MSEELWPTTDWGTNYLTVPLVGRNGGNFFRVLAGTNNTQVTFTNTQTQAQQVVTLNRGQFYQTVLTTVTHITSSYPVALMQIGAGNTFPNGAGSGAFTNDAPDPTMTQVVSTDRYLSSYSVAAPNPTTDPTGYGTDFVGNFVNLVVRTSDIPNMVLDGNPISPSLFVPIAGTIYSSATIMLTPLGSTNDGHTIASLTNTPFGLTSYGDGPLDSYSEPGGILLSALPTIRINYPSNPSSYPAGQSLVITGKATAAFAGVPISYVTVNGVPVDALDSAGNFFQKVTLAEGQNTCHFVAYDASGAYASVDLTITGSEVHSGINTSSLTAASSVVPVYQRTSLNNATHTLYVDFNLHNNGSYAVSGPVVVEVADISDPSVKVLGADGIAADGNPYYNLTRFLTSDTLAAGGGAGSTSGTDTLEFSVPNGAQFTYSLIVMAAVNQPPRFTSEPNLEVSTGGTYRYTPTTFDPQGEAVTVAIAGGPPGMTLSNGQIVWPVSVPAGAYNVELTATDTGGGTATQTFTITVQAPLRTGPIFESTPPTNAEVGQPYSYQPVVYDPDGLPVTFSITNQPAGSQFNSSTGALTWTPTAAQAGSATRHDHRSRFPRFGRAAVHDQRVLPTGRQPAVHRLQLRALGRRQLDLPLPGAGGRRRQQRDHLQPHQRGGQPQHQLNDRVAILADARQRHGLGDDRRFRRQGTDRHAERLRFRLLPSTPATISGTVIDDVTNQPESGWVVFLDSSSTAIVPSTNDPFTLTAADGTYSLSTTLTGTQYLHLEPQTGFQIDPATPGVYSLSLFPGAGHQRARTSRSWR